MPTQPRPDERVPAAEANRNFSRLLREVQGGKSFVVTSHGRPVARITQVDSAAADTERAERVNSRKAFLEWLVSRPALNTPAQKITREELWDEMMDEPFRPDWLQE